MNFSYKGIESFRTTEVSYHRGFVPRRFRPIFLEVSSRVLPVFGIILITT